MIFKSATVLLYNIQKYHLTYATLSINIYVDVFQMLTLQSEIFIKMLNEKHYRDCDALTRLFACAPCDSWQNCFRVFSFSPWPVPSRAFAGCLLISAPRLERPFLEHVRHGYLLSFTTKAIAAKREFIRPPLNQLHRIAKAKRVRKSIPSTLNRWDCCVIVVNVFL